MHKHVLGSWGSPVSGYTRRRPPSPRVPLPRSSFSGQVDGIIKGVLGQSKESNPLSACHETTSPDWLVHVETDEQLGRLGK